jgi:hypothetical protein
VILGDKHGTCRLCLAKADLCESHIVPEFCYDYEQTGSKRQALLLHSLDDGVFRRRVIQKGHREYLLCKECEQRICQQEHVFADIWKNSTELSGPLKPSQLVVVHSENYHRVKLFILSVFWRASLSKALGKAMQLGPYGERLRKILLEDEQVPQNQYPVLGKLILGPDGYPVRGLVTNPDRIKLGQATAYRMAFALCEWIMIMSDHWVPKPFDEMHKTLAPNGDIYLVTQSYRDVPSVRVLAKAIRKA